MSASSSHSARTAAALSLGNDSDSAAILREVPPAIASAIQRFQADLANLLQEHPGQWAAYEPNGRIALGTSKAALHQQCLMAGMQPAEFAIRKIVQADEDIEVLYDA